MKNFILKTALIAFAAFAILSPKESSAQVVQMTKVAASDTAVINTGTCIVYSIVSEPRAVITLQASLVKNSGTGAGTVRVQGSLDGVSWLTLKLSGDVPADTVNVSTIANVTNQSFLWTIQPSKYLYYRLYALGTGTMNVRMKGYLLKRKLQD